MCLFSTGIIGNQLSFPPAPAALGLIQACHIAAGTPGQSGRIHLPLLFLLSVEWTQVVRLSRLLFAVRVYALSGCLAHACTSW
jgi:hypothetical protein